MEEEESSACAMAGYTVLGRFALVSGRETCSTGTEAGLSRVGRSIEV